MEETKSPATFAARPFPSPGYVTVVAQRIRGLTGYHGAKLGLTPKTKKASNFCWKPFNHPVTLPKQEALPGLHGKVKSEFEIQKLKK